MAEYELYLTRISRIKTESTILTLYGKVRLRENPYSSIIHAKKFYTTTMSLGDFECFY